MKLPVLRTQHFIEPSSPFNCVFCTVAPNLGFQISHLPACWATETSTTISGQSSTVEDGESEEQVVGVGDDVLRPVLGKEGEEGWKLRVCYALIPAPFRPLTILRPSPHSRVRH
jgi:hypothetical protein